METMLGASGPTIDGTPPLASLLTDPTDHDSLDVLFAQL
jgi:hypothetical protein